ncbi:MAG: ribonuclease catalytic domain-containing protein [Burkholderiales bacterium]
MNVFYEDEGTLKVASVLADNAASLQVETLHGKRAKIKANHVLIKFERPSLAEFFSDAQNIANDLDADFLWECAGEGEFDFTSLAKEYFGDASNERESAGLLLRLHASPMHFYRRGKGIYKAAPKEALTAAKLSVEKKRAREQQQARYVAQLNEGELPEAFHPILSNLLYKPDKSSLEWKALSKASEEAGVTPAKLLARIGAITSTHDYHFNRFLFEYFPGGADFGESPELSPLRELPLSPVEAFSIDDVTTTEIDDAFSVSKLANGNWQIGVHIAAPALGIAKASALDQIAAKRLSTIYMPGNKITMLPPEVVGRFSLEEGDTRPALSFYVEAAAGDLSPIKNDTRIEAIRVAANLRHDDLDHLDEQAFAEEKLPERFGMELKLLWRFALGLERLRGKPSVEGLAKTDYNFYVDGDRVRIVQRQRGNPVDTLVSELMILVNSRWGELLAKEGVVGIYRGQSEGKIKLSTVPLPHQGLNVAQYLWASSPLRRYLDLVNQRQIIALASGETPPYEAGSEDLFTHLRDFELAYDAYAEFQRTMERYWCLRWLLQEDVAVTGAEVIRENLVRFDHLPLFVKISSIPALPTGSRVEIGVRDIDLFELTLRCEYRRRLDVEAAA